MFTKYAQRQLLLLLLFCAVFLYKILHNQTMLLASNGFGPFTWTGLYSQAQNKSPSSLQTQYSALKKKTWNPYCYWSPARCQNNQTQLKPNYHPMPINIKNANYIHDKGSTPKIFNNNHSTFAKFS
jgi:hypothetical protein